MRGNTLREAVGVFSINVCMWKCTAVWKFYPRIFKEGFDGALQDAHSLSHNEHELKYSVTFFFFLIHNQPWLQIARNLWDHPDLQLQKRNPLCLFGDKFEMSFALLWKNSLFSDIFFLCAAGCIYYTNL